MKKIYTLLIALFMFIGVGNVKAATEYDLHCYYYFDLTTAESDTYFKDIEEPDYMSCSFSTTDGSYLCRVHTSDVTEGSGKAYGASHFANIEYEGLKTTWDWNTWTATGAVKLYLKDKKQCIPYIMVERLRGNYSLYGADTRTRAEDFKTTREAVNSGAFFKILTASTAKPNERVITESDKQKEFITKLTSFVHGLETLKVISGVESDAGLDKYCLLKDGVYTYGNYANGKPNTTMCHENVLKMEENIKTYNKEVGAALANSYISTDNDLYKRYKSATDTVSAALGSFIEDDILEAGTAEDHAREIIDLRDKIESDKEGNAVEKTCEGLIGENTLNFLRFVRNIIMIVGPILAVILGTYDMLVAMASGEEEAKKKGIKRLKGRLIAAVLLLLVPEIIVFITSFVSKVGANCI